MRRLLLDLGYVVHTPGELFGTRDQAYGAEDTDWLARLTGTGWAVLGRDAKILRRDHELAAYRAAKVHMFLLPGQATSEHLRAVTAANLVHMGRLTAARRTGVWRLSLTAPPRAR